MNIFKYQTIELPEGSQRISPSKLYQFFTNPSTWYREEVLQESGFQGNTASIIGTICHFIYEEETNGNHVTRDFITDQLKQHFTTNPDLIMNVDIQEVQNVYPQVASAVMNQYVLLKNNEILVNHGMIETELPMKYCLDEENQIWVSGTCDRVENQHVLVDYKHVNKKPAETMPYGYRLQLLTYAYIYNKTHKDTGIDEIRLVYGVKPTKTLTARCMVVSEQVSIDSMIEIENVLKLVVDSIKIGKEHPELIPIIYKDLSLMEKTNG